MMQNHNQILQISIQIQKCMEMLQEKQHHLMLEQMVQTGARVRGMTTSLASMDVRRDNIDTISSNCATRFSSEAIFVFCRISAASRSSILPSRRILSRSVNVLFCVAQPIMSSVTLNHNNFFIDTPCGSHSCGAKIIRHFLS